MVADTAIPANGPAPQPVAAHSSPAGSLPPLTAQQAGLLAALLKPGSTPTSAAKETGLAPPLILSEIAAGPVRDYLAVNQAMEDAADRRIFLAELRKIVESSEDPIERRRAATAGLRALRPIIAGAGPSSPFGGGPAGFGGEGGGGGSSSTASTTRSVDHRSPRSPSPGSPLDTTTPGHRDTASETAIGSPSPSHRLTPSPSQASIHAAIADEARRRHLEESLAPDPRPAPPPRAAIDPPEGDAPETPAGARESVERQLAAVKNNNDPEPDSGLATLYAHWDCTRMPFRPTYPWFLRMARDQWALTSIIGHTAHELRIEDYDHGTNSATIIVKLTRPDGTDCHVEWQIYCNRSVQPRQWRTRAIRPAVPERWRYPITNTRYRQWSFDTG